MPPPNCTDLELALAWAMAMSYSKACHICGGDEWKKTISYYGQTLNDLLSMVTFECKQEIADLKTSDTSVKKVEKDSCVGRVYFQLKEIDQRNNQSKRMFPANANSREPIVSSISKESKKEDCVGASYIYSITKGWLCEDLKTHAVIDAKLLKQFMENLNE